MQLGLTSERLNIIEHDHVFKAEPCCNAMLEKWLQIDTTASWRKLFTVIATLFTFKIGQLFITDKGKVYIHYCIATPTLATLST